MKLQTEYSKVTIISSISVLLIAAIGYYFLLRYVLREQLDEALRVEEVEILDYVNKKHSLPEATSFKDQLIRFEKTDKPVTRYFKTGKLSDPLSDYELARQLIFPINVNGNYYAASVMKSQEETEELIGIILLITLGLILLLGILLFFFNRFLLGRLWRPFYTILSSIKNFNLQAPTIVKFPETPIDEFRELGGSVALMTEKVVKDYSSLKNFADHASHEMQTPLAVINSRLDILIQDTSLSESSLHQVQSIYDSVNKMSRLGQSLLMLTRIENSQYSAREQVNIKEVVESKLNELEELIHGSHFEVSLALSDLIVSMNRELADILITNLLTNAIHHTKEDKKIVLFVKANCFRITNQGSKRLNEKMIFDRFAKADSSTGTGLGLAIARQICELYGFNLSYDFIEGSHHFQVNFKN